MYSTVVTPLTQLTEKDGPFLWDECRQKVVDTFKAAFTSANLLRHSDRKKQLVLEPMLPVMPSQESYPTKKNGKLYSLRLCHAR